MIGLLFLGIIPGTNIQISFYVWIVLMIGAVFALTNFRLNTDARTKLNLATSNLAATWSQLILVLVNHIARHKRFAVQLEILEQRLGLSVIRPFDSNLTERLKINR